MKAKTTNSKSAKNTPVVPMVTKTIKSEPVVRKSPKGAAVVGPPIKVATDKEQLRQILMMVKSIRNGDFSVKLDLDDESLLGDIAEVLNDINEINMTMANEFVRVGKIVGKEGKMTERVSIGSVRGAWSTNVESVNNLIGDLVQPITEAARVITSVAKGDREKCLEAAATNYITKPVGTDHLLSVMHKWLTTFGEKRAHI